MGGLLTASYVVLVLAHALRPADGPIKPHKSVSRLAEGAALALALCSLLLGFVADGAVSLDALSGALKLSDLWSAILLLVGGGVLAVALGRRLPQVPVGDGLAAIVRPGRRATVAVGGMLAGVDGVLRQWPVASLALIAVAIAFGAALLAGR